MTCELRVFALAAIAVACGDTSTVIARPDAAAVDTLACVEAECAPYVCVASGDACHQECVTELECAGGYLCREGECFGDECTPETATMKCGAYACVNGRCVTDCALGNCAPGHYCRGDIGECVPRCTTLGDPVCAGFACDVGSGECEPYCFPGELACAAGYACDAAQTCHEDLNAPPCSAGCGAYACVEALDHCASHCLEDRDCAVSAACIDGACN